MPNILHIDSSARGGDSLTRRLSADLVQRLAEGSAAVVYRDVGASAPGLVDAHWVEANFTPPEARTDAHRARLAESDALVDELEAADVVVIGAPIYNFGVPAALKAWVDMIGRVHRTFRYTAQGPEGLLTGKRAIIVTASGGTQVGTAMDFMTPYLRHVLGFVGIADVAIIAAERGDEAGARAQLEALVAA